MKVDRLRLVMFVAALLCPAVSHGGQGLDAPRRTGSGSGAKASSAPRAGSGERAGFDDTVPVTFSYIPTGSPKTVTVAGTFNAWNKAATNLVRRTAGLAWTATINLAPGVYQYKYVVNDSRWIAPPDVPRVDDGHGNINAVLTVTPPDYSKRPAMVGDGLITPSAVSHRVEASAPTTTVRGVRFVRRTGKGQIELTLRTRHHDVQSCRALVETADGSRADSVAMTVQTSDTLFDYWRCTVAIPAGARSLRYAFALRDGAAERLYDRTQTLWEGQNALTTFELKTDDYPPFETPDWARDAVFYQIFPDRFANGDKKNDPADVRPWGSPPTGSGWMGGDLPGVLNHFEYLRSLGINGLYFNPIFQTRSNHGYDTTDYKRVDPRFGDLADLKSITARAHLHGWHVILDGVFNHTGVDFEPFKSLEKDGAKSPYRKWYFVKGFPVSHVGKPTNYQGWNNLPWMPKLNVMNPETRDYLLDVATYWMEAAKIDGWRLDAANEVSQDYWKRFRKAVKKEKPDALILAEIWTDADDWLQGDQMDTVTNYPWRGAVLDFFARETASPSRFDTSLSDLRSGYPREATQIMFNLLDSHDTERIRNLCGGDWGKQRQAVLFQMTYPGIPVVYYGDEIGLEGGRDPDNRRAMEWDETKWDRSRLDFYKAAIAMRREHAVLRRGDFKTVAIDDSRGTYAFLRTNGAERALVVFNRSDTPHQASIPISKIGAAKWKTWIDSGGKIEWQGDHAAISLPARGFVVLGN